jgi:tetratricopeptide (TPR) repeat protein
MRSSTLTLPQVMQHALAAYQRGDSAEAARLCRLMLDAKPDYFDALYLSGIVAEQTGSGTEAVELLSRAVAANPDVAEAHYNLGVALAGVGRADDALQSYDRVTALKPDLVDAHYNRGLLLVELGRSEQALENYDRAVALDPGRAEVHNNRGIALGLLGRHEDALASYDRALVLKPDYARASNNRGAALVQLGRFDDALASYDRAIACKPDYAEAYNNRGIALSELDRAAEALESYERALAIRPAYADAFYNRGNALRDLYRHHEAVASYERALALQPDHASAHWNLADCLLLLGDFARGWQEYQWRWKLTQRNTYGQDFDQPLWLGTQPLAGRTIVLHSELGLGDTLQFCRYAKQVAALGARVVLDVQPALRPLLAGLEGAAEVVARGDPLPQFDFHCPLMSLPLAFRTDLGSIPAPIPYLRSDAARVSVWEKRLGARMKPRVGVVWSGSRLLPNDKRSMSLAQMLPLLGDWAEWVSLQKDVPAADAGLLASHPALRPLGSEFADFADTAALVELMDIVVTVDTSVAHVAGGMGKPLWVMLPFNQHDWRWMLGREDSLWYPTARLFRQSASGDWEGVISRVREALMQRFGASR